MKNEVWLPVPGFKSYEVSDQGRIRSYHRGQHTFAEPKILNTHFNKKGYALVHLRQDGKRKNVGLHRLILTVFAGEPENNDLQAAHSDGDTSNNYLYNLYWATAKQNINDKWDHGRMPIGEQTTAAKLSEYDVKKIRRLANVGMAGIEITKCYPVTNHTIYRVISRKIWRHI